MSPRIKGEAAHVYVVKRTHVYLKRYPLDMSTCREALLLVTINDQSFKIEGLRKLC